MLSVSIQLFQNCTGSMYKNECESLMLFRSDCEVLIRLQIFMPEIFAAVLAIEEAMVQPMLVKL